MDPKIKLRERLRKMALASQVFTPGAPINQYDLFSGRIEQIRDVFNAVAQRGRHVILYGERGVGKTSLANILAEILPDDHYIHMQSRTVNCDVSDDFSSIWNKVFREITVERREDRAGFAGDVTSRVTTLNEYIERDVRPDDIRYILQGLRVPAMIIIDEIDRLQDKTTTTLLADTIKTLSDHSTDTTVVLVGVADSVSDLMTEHASIERALVQVRMPRMSRKELDGILENGLNELKMTMSDEARNRIVRLSLGLPHYTHALGLYASQRAAEEDRTEISLSDVETAIKTAVEKTQQSIRDAYHRATTSPRKENLYSRVLLACALAPTDILGYFSAAGVRTPLSSILGKTYEIASFIRHLYEFSEKRGPVLQRAGTARKYRFRFVNPLMQPFVIAHGLANGIIDYRLLDSLTGEETTLPDA